MYILYMHFTLSLVYKLRLNTFQVLLWECFNQLCILSHLDIILTYLSDLNDHGIEILIFEGHLDT